jgi:hypothetical protein
MVVSVVVGFLYMFKDKFLVYFCIVISRKLILLSISFYMVNFIVGIKLLKLLNTSSILVVVLLYMIRISSTYRKYPIMCFFSLRCHIWLYSRWIVSIFQRILRM